MAEPGNLGEDDVDPENLEEDDVDHDEEGPNEDLAEEDLEEDLEEQHASQRPAHAKVTAIIRRPQIPSYSSTINTWERPVLPRRSRKFELISPVVFSSEATFIL
jgi:hypothetical protein